jgi:N-acetylglucosamine-6-sulfatase
VVESQVLTIDLAPTLLELCQAPPLPNIHGRSFKKPAQGDSTGWRRSWYYEYNYEKQFPYTPNVRGVRTDDWKYIHYPPGGGGNRPDSHRAELYHLASDPAESKNLIADPAHANTVRRLRNDLARLIAESGASPDVMPADEGIKDALPEKSIR